MWSGSTIPAGWALCDGTNGTPDMRDRFVLGAGNSYILGNTGGSGSHSHTIQGHAHSMPHTHLFYIGNHTHTYGGNVGVASNSAHADGNGSVGILASADHLHSYSGTTGATNLSGGTEQSSSARTGSETLTSNDTTVLPPYFAISFIMKL
jgi:microcystin-dependent protein